MPNIARADVTGNDLQPNCDGKYGTQGSLYCLSYLTGALDAFRMLDASGHMHLICEPPGVTGEQLLAVLKKYLNDHPEQLHMQGAGLVLAMMNTAFSCPPTSN
jgi:hypothetical protein